MLLQPSTCPWLDHPVSGLLPATVRPIKTRFPFAYPRRLSLLLRSKSLTHYTKGTQSPRKDAPTACTYTDSGSISLPSPGFFSPFPHGTGSLSVGREYLALEDGPPMFRQGFTCPALLDFTCKDLFIYRAITVYGQTFQNRSTKVYAGLRAGPRSLVATWRVSIDFLSSGYLDISVPRVRLDYPMYSGSRYHVMWWVSPFGNPRIKAFLSAPRGLSQTYTSFIAFCRQGIHRVRLVTWSYNRQPSRFAIFPVSLLDSSFRTRHTWEYAPVISLVIRHKTESISSQELSTENCFDSCKMQCDTTTNFAGLLYFPTSFALA